MASRRHFLKMSVLFAAGMSVRPGAWALEPPVRSPAVRHFLCFGDWGFTGREQGRVARAMTVFLKANPGYHGVLSLGDNFYGELKKGVHDIRWKAEFEEMYPRPVFDQPFYALLGNHDYDDQEGKAQIELDYAAAHPGTRWTLPSRWYRTDFTDDSGRSLMTALTLDSNHSNLAKKQWKEQIAWLERQLSGPRGRWTLVMAHHPLFTNGTHGDNDTLIDEWGPLFEKYRVDAYLAGHDHDLEHLQVKGYSTDFLISGGGGAPTRPGQTDENRVFYRSVYGFMHLAVGPEEFAIRFYDAEGAVLYGYQRIPT
ncbi:MAG: metallophosphoesterase [Verrucomicrobiae bacterium]|nr:metallophosphoesterase [Verrucomicrobiae bacterium]